MNLDKFFDQVPQSLYNLLNFNKNFTYNNVYKSVRECTASISHNGKILELSIDDTTNKI